MKMLASMKTRCPSGIWSSVKEAILFLEHLAQCLFPDRDGGPALLHDPLVSLGGPSGRLAEVAFQSLFQDFIKGPSLAYRFELRSANQVLVKLGADPLMHLWMMVVCRRDVKDVGEKRRGDEGLPAPPQGGRREKEERPPTADSPPSAPAAR